MAKYIVNFTDPMSPHIDIPPKRDNGPGRTDSDTSLRLFGEGYTHWGESTNENFVRLLENFMGATPPINPVPGQLWAESSLYHKDGSNFYSYDLDPNSGTYQTWVTISVTSQATPPSEIIGSYWFDTNTDTLNYFGSGYDGQPASWMARSYGAGTGLPSGGPAMAVRMFDGGANEWVVIGGALVTDSTSPPAGARPGILRFAPATSTLYVWNGSTWTALIDATNPVFAGDIDMDSNKITNLADATNDTDALNRQTGDARYVNVSGDTMTGALVLNGDPTAALHAAPKQYVESWAAAALHSHSVVDITDAGTAAAADIGILPANVPLTSNITGKQTIWVPAGAMHPRVSGGAGAATVETATNKVSFRTLNFDPAIEEFAQCFIRMPPSWDESDITVQLVWSHATTTISFSVVWGVSAVAFSDGVNLDAAFGSEQTVTDVGGATNVLYSTTETAGVVVAGAVVAGSTVALQVSRKVSDPSDLLAIDARLHGITVYYHTDALNDA